MNKTIFNKDYEYGTNSEIDTLSLMKKYFNDNTLKINNDKYGSFDYIGKDVNVELKTRRINYTQANTYGDLIFSYSKYKKWLVDKKDTYICWKLLDKICYWKMNLIEDKWITTNPFRNDGAENNSNIIHIPMNLIKTF